MNDSIQLLKNNKNGETRYTVRKLQKQCDRNVSKQ